MEEQILDFLDGHLESTDEEELLHRLAVSPEKRGLLREHMKLREAVTHVSRTEQLAVPTNVTASLYRKLAYNGYAGASLGSTVSVTRPMMAAAPAIAAKSVVPVYQGYRLTSLLTFAVLSFFVGVGFTSIVDRSTSSEPASITSAQSSEQPPIRTLADPSGKSTSGRTITTWQAVPHDQRKTDVEVNNMLAARYPQYASLVKSEENVSNEIVRDENMNPQIADVEVPAVEPVAHLAIDSRFFAEPIDEAVVSPTIDDLTFDARVTDINLGSASSSVATISVKEIENAAQPITPNAIAPEAASPEAVTPEQITPPPTITHPSEEITPVEIRPLSLRSDVGLDGPEPIDFTFGSYAKRPAATFISLRSGGGQLPGSDRSFSGSLTELRLSYQVNDLIVVKASAGEFAPWESVAQSDGSNGYGVTLITTKPTLKFRYVVGAELGLIMNPFSIPLEVSAGGLVDEFGSHYPRAALMSTINVNREFSLHIGLEAIVYYFDVEGSVASQMSYYGGKNPAVVDGLPKRTLSGFIGPTIEAAWHF